MPERLFHKRIESIEDSEDMREVDIEEHREALAHGIPEHLGICPNINKHFVLLPVMTLIQKYYQTLRTV